MKEVKLYIEDNGNREFETVKDLMSQIEQDREYSIEHGKENEFLNSKIILQLTDIEGQIVQGKMCLSVGVCTENNFVLVGNVEEIIAEKLKK